MQSIAKAKRDNPTRIDEQPCPLCGCAQMTVFFEMEKAPVFCNVLWENPQQAIAAPVAPIRLALCRNCGLIYNIAFDAELMNYSAVYENSLHFSPRFQAYAEELADELIETYDVHGRHVVEIGCGGAEFLNLLCSRGGNRGTGFDPGYDRQKSAASRDSSTVKIVCDEYSPEYAGEPARLICCRHVLEHIEKPLEFIRRIRESIDPAAESVLFFEVPNALYSFERMGIWDIIYEHCSYFTAQCLSNLFLRAGFEPLKVAERYGGQFVTIEARPADGKIENVPAVESAAIAGVVSKFSTAYKQTTQQWRHKLEDFDRQGKKVVLWGAGSKGISFLNALGISNSRLPYIVDLNPRKQNRFVPGTGQQVIAPALLEQYKPDLVIVMNPLYLEEIRQMLKQLAVNADVIEV